MDITNISSDTYVLIGGRTLSPGLTLHVDNEEYGDERLRDEINALYNDGKISVANVPSGFPISDNMVEISGGEWFGPYSFTFDDYNPDLGFGWDGILIDVDLVSLAPGGFLLKLGVTVDEDFQNAGATCFPYVGTLAGGDYSTAQEFSLDAVQYGGGMAVCGMLVGGYGGGGLISAAIPISPGVSQVWIDSFGSPPTSGSGRLWINAMIPN